MGSEFRINYHLDVNKRIVSKRELSFWKCLLSTIVEYPGTDLQKTVLKPDKYSKRVCVEQFDDCPDFEDKISTEFCYTTKQWMGYGPHDSHFEEIASALYQVAKSRNVRIATCAIVWDTDGGPEILYPTSWEEMKEWDETVKLEEIHS